MGRYTTVQAYGDSNPNMRAVSYEQAGGGGVSGGTIAAGATTSTSATSSVLKTEKVSNPYGSTAGAGSGEFHIYRQMRSREMSRLKKLDEEEAEKLAQDEYQSKVLREEQECLEKTSKKRRKRQRAKESLRRKKVLKQNQILGNDNADADGDDEEDDEFQYTPMFSNDNASNNMTNETNNEENENDNHKDGDHKDNNKNDSPKKE